MPGRIPEEDLERVRAASDIVEVASERLTLKRNGRRYVALCPFHNEKTPSFSINPETGLYHCFGCGVSGNVFQFLMGVEDVGFVDAVERLARRAGIEIAFLDEAPADRRRRQLRPRIEAVLARARDFFTDRLLRAEDAGGARGYLRSRGYDRDVAVRFGVGWAPAARDALVAHLRSAGFREEEIAEAGVALRDGGGGLHDQLRGRVVFTISDPQGQPIGFGGRALEAAGPKYLNTPETMLYHKSSVLYGMNWAKADVVARDEVVVVEGYTDVIGFHLAGATNTVATCGTALGDQHLRLLKRFTPHVVLAFDGDTAGEAATEKVFEATSRLGLDVRVALLPRGTDPAELAAEGSAAVEHLLARTVPLLEFKVDHAVAGIAMDSAEGERRALDAGAAAVAAHPDSLARRNAARGLARRLRDVTEDVAIERVEALRRGEAPPATARPGSDSPVRVPRVEAAALCALLQRPATTLGGVPDLSPEWFTGASARSLAAVGAPAARARAGDAVPGAAGDDRPLDVGSLGVPAEALSLAGRLAVIEPPGFDALEDFAREAATALQRVWVARRIRELHHALQVAESAGDVDTVQTCDDELVAFIDLKQSMGES